MIRKFGLTAVLALGFASCVTAKSGQEEWVNANLLRVKVAGVWQDVPLVPLADHLCASEHELYRKHCEPQGPASRR